MKKQLFIAALACTTLTVQAAEKKGVLYLDSPAGYQVLSISDNGLWACGSYYNVDTDESHGFRWNLSTSKIEDFESGSEAYTVSNDGTVAGAYYTKAVTGSSLQVPGLWNNGQWTMLELPNKKGAWATAITPDGHYVTGTDNNYNSYIWKDGKIENKCSVMPIASEANGYFLTYAISPDGTKAGGWAYYSDDNRNPGYWDAADHRFHELNPGNPGSPWQSVRKFSADGKKVLYWGGYHEDPFNKDKGYGIQAIYDLGSKQNTIIYPIWADPFNFDLYDIGGKGTVVGMIQDDEGTEQAIVYAGGKTQFAEEYLEKMGADFSGRGIYQIDEDTYYIFRAMALSTDEKKYAVLYYDEEFYYHTMVVMFDQDMSMMPPVQVATTQMPGIMTANVTWDKPLGDVASLKGYNVYRDGAKLNSEPIGTTQYYDKSLAAGTYSYTVTAVYTEGESAKSEASQLTINAIEPQAPADLLARQKGYNTAYAQWAAPSTNLTQANYYGDGSTSMDAFGGGEISFETAIRFDADVLDLYDGYRLAGVSFYPMSEQGSWIINLYRHVDDKLTLLRSIPVTQQLVYGEKNTVLFAQPLALQAGQDLLVGVQTNVTESSFNVQGIYDNCLKVGYSDLLRQVGEEDFYSINVVSPNGGYDITWATSALLAPADASAGIDDIDHYNVFVDGVKAVETKNLTYENNTLSDGAHTIGVQAIYSDARQSATRAADLTIAANEQKLQIVPTVSVEGDKMTATWATPSDCDPTTMGYCSDTKATRSPSATNDVSELTARVDFTPAELKSYVGYSIQELSFMPLSDSGFELQVYEGEESLIAAPVEEFTLGKWNTITLDEPIEVKAGKTYHYLVVCYDCPAGAAPLAMDNMSAQNSYSDLIQAAGEDGWYGIYEETGLDGNWMMRIKLVQPNATPMAVSSYDIFIDGDKKATQTANQYAQQFNLDATKHSVRVDATYSALQKTIKGESVNFQLLTTGIADVKGETASASPAFNVAGQRVNDAYKGIIIRGGKTLLKK